MGNEGRGLSVTQPEPLPVCAQFTETLGEVLCRTKAACS